MARLSLSEVTSSAAVLFPDNTTKLITPAKMRQFISEFTTAIRPAYGYILQTAPLVQALTTTPSPLVMSASTVSPIVDFTCTPNIAKVTRNDPGMTRITITADIQGSTNTQRLISFQIYKNGVATAWKQTIGLTTSTLIESISLPALEYLNGIAEYQLMVSADANYSVTFSNAAMICETVPVWTYT